MACTEQKKSALGEGGSTGIGRWRLRAKKKKDGSSSEQAQQNAERSNTAEQQSDIKSNANNGLHLKPDVSKKKLHCMKLQT